MVKLNMKTAARILLIVTATFINTECFRTFEKRQDIGSSTDESSCLETITNCAPTLFNHPFIVSTNDFGTLVPNIDQICSDYQTGRQCLEPLFESCHSFQQELQEIYRLIDFFCSNRGKSLLREFQHSVCYNDFYDVGPSIPVCISESESTTDHHDQTELFMHTYHTCLINKFTAACGEAGGRILSFIMDIENLNNVNNDNHA